MYERGSNQWYDPYPNGAANGPAAEHVWYRSPSGEAPAVQHAQDPQQPYPQQPYPQQGYPQQGYPQPEYPQQPYYQQAYAPPSFEATAYEDAYAPATQAFPTVPAAPAADVTTYDPTTGLPMAGEPIVYPMRNVAGRMAMILGVFAILFTSVLFPLFPLAFFFAFGAIMLGRRGRLRARYGFASNPGSAGGGFALGVLGMVLAVIWTAASAWLFTTYSANDLRNCIQDASAGADAIRCIADVVDAA